MSEREARDGPPFSLSTRASKAAKGGGRGSPRAHDPEEEAASHPIHGNTLEGLPDAQEGLWVDEKGLE